MLKKTNFELPSDFSNILVLLMIAISVTACGGNGAAVASPAEVPHEMPKMQDDHSAILKLMENARENAIEAEKNIKNAQ